MTARPLGIRSYRAADLSAVAQLFTSSVHALSIEHYDASHRAAWAPRPPDLDEWQRRLAALRTLVAEEDSHLAGFLSYQPHGHIEFLYVAPPFVRRSVATALLQHAEAVLTSLGVRKLTTEASLVARPFFERQGFVVTEEQVTEEQQVERRGVHFRRFAMTKYLASSRTVNNDDFGQAGRKVRVSESS